MPTEMELQARAAARGGNSLLVETDPTGIIKVSETPLIAPPDAEQPAPKVQPETIDFAKLNRMSGGAAEEPAKPVTSEEPAQPAPAAGYATPATCPHCGWKTTDPDVQASPEDKEEFVRCALGNRPFKKAYDLFGGRIKVGFTSLTIAHEDILAACMRRWLAQGDSSAYAKVTLQRDQWQFVSMFDMVEMGGERSSDLAVPYTVVKANENEDPAAAADRAVERLEKQWQLLSEGLPPGVLSTAWAKHTEFQRLMAHLIAHAGDESFWTGLSLA